MTKLQAKAVADRYLLAIRVHYRGELERLREVQALSEIGVTEWVDSGAYRKKGHDAPHVATQTLQHDYGRYILRALEDASKFPKVPDAPMPNVCEHGDHPAPAGKRFCSEACCTCDGTDAPEGDLCAGVCGRSHLPD